MRDVHGQAGLAADGNGFVNRGEHAGALVAHMGGIMAPVPRRHAGQGDELLFLGIGARVVVEPGGETPGALLHASVDQLLHAFQLLGRGRAIRVAHDLGAQGIMRHLVDHIGAGMNGLEPAEVGCHIERPAAAVAGDDRGDALHEIAKVRAPGGLRQRGNAGIAMRVQIDEAGGNHQAFAVDDPRLPGRGELTDAGDTLALDGQVPDLTRLAGAVMKRCPANDEIGLDRRIGRSRQQDQRKHHEVKHGLTLWCERRGAERQAYHNNGDRPRHLLQGLFAS